MPNRQADTPCFWNTFPLTSEHPLSFHIKLLIPCPIWARHESQSNNFSTVSNTEDQFKPKKTLIEPSFGFSISLYLRFINISPFACTARTTVILVEANRQVFSKCALIQQNQWYFLEDLQDKQPFHPLGLCFAVVIWRNFVYSNERCSNLSSERAMICVAR